MSARRPISCCLGAVAAAVLLLGCGSGNDVTNADIDPLIANDLKGQLDRIQGYFEEGDCEHAAKAVDNLKTQADLVKGKTGERFNANLNEIADNLAEKVEQDCDPAEPDTTETETTDTEPIITEPTTEPTTTETTTSDDTVTPDPNTPPPSGGNGGGNNGGNTGGNNGGTNPGGGISPGKRGSTR